MTSATACHFFYCFAYKILTKFAVKDIIFTNKSYEKSFKSLYKPCKSAFNLRLVIFLEMMSIQDFANMQGVTYEAVRQQLKRYEKELDGHIHKVKRKFFLDEEAMDFLKDKRADNPLGQFQQDKSAEIEELKSQIARLLTVNGQLNQRIGELGERVAVLAEENAKVLMLEQSVQSKEDKIKQLEDTTAAQTAEIADFKALVADKDKSLEDGKKQLYDEQQAHYNTASELAETQKQLSEAQQVLDEFRNLPWYKKAFWKKK